MLHVPPVSLSQPLQTTSDIFALVLRPSCPVSQEVFKRCVNQMYTVSERVGFLRFRHYHTA